MPVAPIFSLLFFFLICFTPCVKAESGHLLEQEIELNSIEDLPIEVIDRAIERERERSKRLESYLLKERVHAEKTLNNLEKRLDGLVVAIYYQDYSNFLFLTYYCRQISELNKEYLGGNSPFSKVKVRMEMAIQRFVYIQQVLEGNKEKAALRVTAAQEAKVHAAEKLAAAEKSQASAEKKVKAAQETKLKAEKKAKNAQELSTKAEEKVKSAAEAKASAEKKEKEAQEAKASAEGNAVPAPKTKERAEVEKAQTQLEKAQAEREKLRGELELADTEFEKASFELEKAKSELEEAPAEIAKARAELEKAHAKVLTMQAKLKEAHAKVVDRIIDNCEKLESTYRKEYEWLSTGQGRFDELGKRIHALNIYANGREVEQHNVVASAKVVVDLKKITSQGSEDAKSDSAAKDSAQAPLKDNKKDGNNKPADESAAPVDVIAALQEGNAHPHMDREKLISEVKAFGTDTGIGEGLHYEKDMQTEGRLVARINMALWNPSHPFRFLANNSTSYRETLRYFWLTLKGNYYDAPDEGMTRALRNLLFFMLGSIALGYAFCRTMLYLLANRAKKLGFSELRYKAMTRPVVLILLALVVYIYSGYVDKGYLASHLAVACEYLLLSAALYLALLVKIPSKRVSAGISVFAPLVWLSGFIVLYGVLMCNSLIVDVSSPFIFMACALVMIWRLWKKLSEIRISLRVYALLSILIMITGSWVCYSGYYYIMMLCMLFWFVLVVSIMSISALKKLSHILVLRISGYSGFAEYKQYVRLWVHLALRQLIIPLVFILMLWYGVFWPAENFDLTQYFSSWASKRHTLESFIRVVSFDAIIGIISVAVGVNCFIQILRQTLMLIYSGSNSIGRVITFVTLGSMLAWGGFIIFVLNQLEADYGSIIVIMGGMSVGIGLGLKDTIENLVCGLSLMLGRMRPGDVVECDGVRGKVANIGYRTTTLETYDGSIICFQNLQLFNQNFRNMTRNHLFERVQVDIGVTYGTDVNRARRLILEALAKLKILSHLNEHNPWVNLNEFGDSSVNLAVFVWVPVHTKGSALSAVREAIYSSFREHGIEIPFPQQDLYIKPLDGATNPFVAPSGVESKKA